MTKAISNAVANAAKGDLKVGSGTNTSAILALGNSGEQIVADSSTSTGLAYIPTFFAGKNKIINGDFRIWQRGTSFTTSVYGADRWVTALSNTSTLTQQTFTPGTAPASPYEAPFYLQMARTTSTGADYLTTRLEDVRLFAGQTVTFSFYAKADSACTIQTYYDQNFGSGGSTQVSTSQTNVAITTSWARYSVTTTLGSMSGKTIGSSSYLAPTFVIPAAAGNRTIGFWGVQLEQGSSATSFQTATGTIQGELAACQRYYYRATAGDNFTGFANGHASGTTTAILTFYPKVTMRTTPSSLDYSTLLVGDGVASQAVTTLAFNASTISPNSLLLTATVASGLTQYRPYYLLANNSSSAYVGLSAEL